MLPLRCPAMARDVADAHRNSHAWWGLPTPEARRLGYYRTMRECYGMTAQQALAQTRRFHDSFGDGFDLMGSLRAAIRPTD
jgi:hypothetical protein